MVYVRRKDGKYAYLRKAADLGSHEAQYVVGDILTDIIDEETRPLRLKIYDQLLDCSFRARIRSASVMLGIGLQRKKRIPTSIGSVSSGTKNGSSLFCRRLEEALSGRQRMAIWIF